MLVQVGLRRTCSETTLLVFPRGGSNCLESVTECASLARRHKLCLIFYFSWGLANGCSSIKYRCSYSTSRILTVALAFIIVPFLPATNLFFRVGFVIAERILYLSSIGYCMIVVLGLRKICESYSKSVTVRLISLREWYLFALRISLRFVKAGSVVDLEHHNSRGHR